MRYLEKTYVSGVLMPTRRSASCVQGTKACVEVWRYGMSVCVLPGSYWTARFLVTECDSVMVTLRHQALDDVAGLER